MKRSLRIIGTCATLLLVAASSSAALKHPGALPSGLITTMALEGGQVLDTRSINVRFTLTNRTSMPQSVLTRGTPLRPIDGPIFEVALDGDALLYYGRYVKYDEPVAADYLTLMPGESHSATVNLGAVYSFDRAGTYRVRLNTLMAGTTSDFSLGRSARDREWAGALPANELRITIESEAIQAFIPPSALRSAAGPVTITSSGWTFEGLNEEQELKANAAIEKAVDMAATAKAMADAALGEPSHWTIKWYGAFNAARAATVAGKWADIVAGFAVTKKNTLVYPGAECDVGVIAYTLPVTEPNKIFLCDAFWTKGPMGFNSRPGVLIHEMGHLKAGLQDHAYGTANCLALATTNPAQAINNADSYEYFAEDLNQKAKTPGLSDWGAAALTGLLATAGIAVLARRRRQGAQAA